LHIVIPIISVASLARTFQVTGAGYFEGDLLSTVTYWNFNGQCAKL